MLAYFICNKIMIFDFWLMGTTECLVVEIDAKTYRKIEVEDANGFDVFCDEIGLEGNFDR